MEHNLPPLKIRLAVVFSLILIFTLIYIFLKCERNTGKIEAMGTIEIKEVDITSRVNAKVEKIFFDEGQEVKKGDILIKLESRVYEAQFNAATSLYNNAQKNYERSKELFKVNSISRQQYEQAEANFLSAKANLEQAKLLFEDTQPKAPWDGIILKRHGEEGELISPNTPLFTIGNLKEVKIIVYVSLKDLGKIKYGQMAKIKIDSFKNKIYEGKITFISDKAEFTPKNIQTKDERVKQVFAVEVSAKNDNYELKPGMPCDVIIDIEK